MNRLTYCKTMKVFSELHVSKKCVAENTKLYNEENENLNPSLFLSYVYNDKIFENKTRLFMHGFIQYEKHMEFKPKDFCEYYPQMAYLFLGEF